MDFRDHQALIIDNWMGVWNRDDPQCPLDHLAGAQNVEPVSGGIGIRSSFSPATPAFTAGTNTSQFQKFNRNIGAEGYIYFDENTRNLYHTANPAPAVPIDTAPAGTTGFSMLCLYNRAYICYHNYSTGVFAGTARLKVYYEYPEGSGTWIFRDAMGAVPSVGTFAASENPAVGVVTAGIHLFRVAYLTDTGFITRMSSAVQMTATGNKKVDLANIPVGPGGAGIIARHILVTKAIPTAEYDGNPDNYEFFFLTLLNDNVTTALSAINFFDSALVSSADYLLDILGSLPGPMGMCPYNGRVMYWGFPDNAIADYGYFYGSRQNDPETISTADGVNRVPANDGGSRSIFCMAEYRGSCYIGKRGKTYATIDNGGEVSTWPVQLVDAGFGIEALFGIARVEDGQIGIHKETIFAANFNGLYAFQGSWTERPLTWKIENEWRSISEATFNRIKVVVQPTEQRIYVLFPSSYNGGNWAANNLWVGDYKLGLDADNIRWFKWQTSANPAAGGNLSGVSHIQSESVLASSGTSRGLLVSFFGTAQPGMWRLTVTRNGGDNFNGLKTISTVVQAPETTSISTSNDNFAFDPAFSESHLHGVRIFLKCTSPGDLQIITRVSDHLGNLQQESSILSAVAGTTYPTFLCNSVGNTFQYLISSSSDVFVWILQRLILFHNPLWESGEM